MTVEYNPTEPNGSWSPQRFFRASIEESCRHGIPCRNAMRVLRLSMRLSTIPFCSFLASTELINGMLKSDVI